MIENIKRINNPLTIIAIFAALAEVTATISLGLIPEELQRIFIWFVLGFPALLVSCFFLTLNFNPKVLYAPSDFRDEKNFINTFSGKYTEMKISVSEENVNEVEEFLQSEIIDDRNNNDFKSEILKFGNAYFKELLPKIKDEIGKGILQTFGLGIQADDLWLLTFTFNKDRFEQGFISEHNYVVRFLPAKQGIRAEIPLIGIQEGDYTSLAQSTFEFILSTINKHLIKKNGL